MNAYRSLPERSLRIALALAVMAGAAAIYSCSDHDSPVDAVNSVQIDGAIHANMAKGRPADKWTFLLYAAADAGPNMYSPLQDFAEQFASGDGVEALCLEDTYGETAKIWYINENHFPAQLEDLGEINMGSVTTLSSFLEYAKSHYPADRYIISFYGHGGGWGGACNDYDPSFDVLRMDDMKEALMGAGGVDLVLFSAPCLMGAFESAYELRECTDVYVASEGLSFYSFWTTVMGSISEKLNSDPNIPNHELAKLIIEWMEEDKHDYTLMGGMRYLTMSAVRTDRLRRLGDAIDDLALGYMADPERFKALVESVREKIIYFDNPSITDLNSVLLNLYEQETEIAMREKLERAMQCLSDVIIAEIHLPKYKDTKGLSIFLPDDANAGVLQYYVDDEFGLDFVPDANWDELLFSIYPPEESMQGVADESFPMLRGRVSRQL
jgi:hypothetical protein